MNTEQKQKLIESIKNDCTLQRAYHNEKGDCCVIGGLVKSMGKDPAEVFDTEEKNVVVIESCQVENVAEALMHYYGLSKLELLKLQKTNDCVSDLTERRDCLIALVNTFPTQ
jgi:hypothetical protein